MKVEIMNSIEAKYDGPNLDPTTMDILNIEVCVPRPKEKKFMKTVQVRVKDPWRLETSFFKDY
jgi:hypothetical protein